MTVRHLRRIGSAPLAASGLTACRASQPTDTPTYHIAFVSDRSGGGDR